MAEMNLNRDFALAREIIDDHKFSVYAKFLTCFVPFCGNFD